MSPPVVHLRRALVNHTNCDQEDGRTLTDDRNKVTCQECLREFDRREAEWLAEQAARTLARKEQNE